MGKKMYSMTINYIQSCWDCGVTPCKAVIQKIKKYEQEQNSLKNWTIAELAQNIKEASHRD